MNIATLIVTAALLTGADELSREEQLKAWGDAHVGTWVGADELDADLPGFGEKGDTLHGETTWVKAGSVYRGSWKGTVNGRVVDSAIGIAGWDAERGRIKIQWHSQNGASAHNVVKVNKDGTWSGEYSLISPDGTVSSNLGETKTDGNSRTIKSTKRKRGDMSLPDKEVTLTKVEDVQIHDTLKPLEPFLGSWKSERVDGTGQLKSVRHDTYSLIHEGRAVRLEWTEYRPDGSVKVSASYIFYFDGAERKIKFIGFGGYGIVEGGTLAKAEDSALHWEVFFTHSNGNQGRYRFKTWLDNGQLKLGWTKISGSGPSDFGPFEYQRVD